MRGEGVTGGSEVSIWRWFYRHRVSCKQGEQSKVYSLAHTAVNIVAPVIALPTLTSPWPIFANTKMITQLRALQRWKETM